MSDNNFDLEVLCRNITLLRKVNGMTQKQLAQIMGVSMYCVQKLEQGIFLNIFGVDSIMRLSCHFHLYPTSLFNPIKKISTLTDGEADLL